MLALVMAAAQPALAATPTDAEVLTAVERLYNKRLPEDAICTARPALPPTFRELVVVGARKGDLGCVPLGIMSDEQIRKTDVAATASIRASVWNSRTPAERAEDMAAFTHGVLLAFVNPEGEPRGRIVRDKLVVTERYLGRIDHTGMTARGEGTYTFDASNGKLLESDVAYSEYYRTALTVRPEKLTGNLTTSAVSTALNSKGALVKRCFRDAWEQDLELDGRVQLTWTVTNGKTENLGVIGSDNPPEQLSKCYAFRAVNTIEWPEDLEGDVHWVFAVARGKADPPSN